MHFYLILKFTIITNQTRYLYKINLNNLKGQQMELKAHLNVAEGGEMNKYNWQKDHN